MPLHVERDLPAVNRHQVAGHPSHFLDRHAHEMRVVDLVTGSRLTLRMRMKALRCSGDITIFCGYLLSCAFQCAEIALVTAS